MGTQTAIAKKIIDGEGDYILAMNGSAGLTNPPHPFFFTINILKIIFTTT
jgi:hypothetical protein